MTPTNTRTTALCFALATLAACGCANQSTGSAAMSDQTRDQNLRNVEQLFERGFNQNDLTVIDELLSPDYVGPQGEKGPAGFRGVAAALHAAFPDIHYTLDDQLAEGDRVAVR